MRSLLTIGWVGVFTVLVWVAPSKGVEKTTTLGEIGWYSATGAAPDMMTTESGQLGVTLTAKEAHPYPESPGDYGMVRVSGMSGGTVTFVGRSAPWGCIYDVTGTWAGGAGQGPPPPDWWSEFKHENTPRLVLEVNLDGEEDDVIAMGTRTGKATVKLLNPPQGTTKVTITDETEHVGVEGNPQELELTTQEPEKEVNLNGLDPGLGELKAHVTTIGPVIDDATVDVLVAEVVIGEVVRGPGLPYSISPGTTKEIAVTFGEGMEGRSVTLSVVDPDDNDAGYAWLDGDEGKVTLTQSDTVTLCAGVGQQQTLPGHSGKLYIQATIFDEEEEEQLVGVSEGFSVCAHSGVVKHGFQIGEVQYGDQVGMAVGIQLTKDTEDESAFLDLVLARAARSNSLDHSGCLQGHGTIHGDADELAVAASIQEVWYVVSAQGFLDALDGDPQHRGEGALKRRQLHVFHCLRCGMAEPVAVPWSGAEVRHGIYSQEAGGGTEEFVWTQDVAAEAALNGFVTGPAHHVQSPISTEVKVRPLP